MIYGIWLFVSGVLFTLSILNDTTAPNLWLWRLSVLTTEFGHWLVLPCLISLVLLAIARTSGRPQKLGPWSLRLMLALNCVAAIGFCYPLYQGFRHQAQWRADLVSAFGEGLPPRLLDGPMLWLGRAGGGPVPYQNFVYKKAGADGPDLTLDYYPPSAPGAAPAAPWVVIVHGGGWDSGDSRQLPELNSHLARLGYGVIAVNYRLAPQFIWPAQKYDVLAAIHYVKDHAAAWNLDGRRWAILGRSAGGQIAGVVAQSLPPGEGPRGLISFYAPTDLVFGYEVGEEDDVLASRGLLRQFLGGPPLERLASYQDASILDHLSPQSCPTLLLHGYPDTLVWRKHSERLFTRLKHLGIATSSIEFPWGVHGFDYNLNGPAGQISTLAITHFLVRVFAQPAD